MTTPSLSTIEIMARMAKAVRVGSKTLGRLQSRLPYLILVTDEHRLANPLAAASEMPAGTAVLFRHYRQVGRADLAAALAIICRQRNLKLWIAGDVKLARSVGAHGVHFPEHMIRLGRPPVPSGMILTASVHSLAALRRAEAIGVDAVLISPIFPSPSHPDRPAIGAKNFRRWVRQSGVPAYGLGGIGPSNGGQLAGSGGAGIAAIPSLPGKHL
ncbi:MAG: thiamine phosphate synthase [Alphaproteobacteria bacterium]|nr:thiamine phosphate synthase [Alphaproteobacteria bacterium]